MFFTVKTDVFEGLFVFKIPQKSPRAADTQLIPPYYGGEKVDFRKITNFTEWKKSKKTSPNVLTRFSDKYWISSFKNIRNFQNRFSSLRDILILKLWNFENFGFRPDLYPRSYRNFNIKWLESEISLIFQFSDFWKCQKNCATAFI